MRHGCGNLSQDRVSVLFGSTESEALSVAFAIHLDDGGVMDQSIDGRRRHGGIGKDRVPGRKRLVGGDSDAASFVSMRLGVGALRGRGSPAIAGVAAGTPGAEALVSKQALIGWLLTPSFLADVK